MRLNHFPSRWLTLALLACTALALPKTARAGADVKVGYVDMQRALNEVEEGKAARAKLKRESASKQKKLDEMQTALKAKKEEFDKQRAMMKPEKRLEQQDALQRELLELQQVYVQLQQELMGNESKITQEIAQKLHSVINKIGDRDGYTLIIDIGDTVLYYKRHQDITDEVVLAYNKQYGKN